MADQDAIQLTVHHYVIVLHLYTSLVGTERVSQMQEALEIETEEEQASRQQQDFEEIRKSYAELESTYSKFLTDSGLSRGGYWRGGVH